jgi:hypothetical protein
LRSWLFFFHRILEKYGKTAFCYVSLSRSSLPLSLQFDVVPLSFISASASVQNLSSTSFVMMNNYLSSFGNLREMNQTENKPAVTAPPRKLVFVCCSVIPFSLFSLFLLPLSLLYFLFPLAY